MMKDVPTIMAWPLFNLHSIIEHENSREMSDKNFSHDATLIATKDSAIFTSQSHREHNAPIEKQEFDIKLPPNIDVILASSNPEKAFENFLDITVTNPFAPEDKQERNRMGFQLARKYKSMPKIAEAIHTLEHINYNKLTNNDI